MKSEFSRADLNLMLDIIHSSIKCRDVSDFDNLLNHIKMVFPFTYARCGFGDSSEFEEKGFEQACKMFSKFPIEWETRYNKKNYVLKDSVALSLGHKKGAIYWSDCINFIGADKTENSESFKILDEAAVFGLQAGWIYSDQERRPSDCTIISFAGDDIKKSRRFEMILEHLGPHISQAIRNIILDQTGIIATLTPREREVLSWAAAGKTAWETSQILNISQRTIEFHMGNIINKLDATNSHQAIAIAVSHGLINY